MARRAPGSTVDLRAENEQYATVRAVGVRCMRGSCHFLCVAGDNTYAGFSTQKQSITAKIFRYKTLRRI